MNECNEWKLNTVHKDIKKGHRRGELGDDDSYCSGGGDIVRDYDREWGRCIGSGRHCTLSEHKGKHLFKFGTLCFLILHFILLTYINNNYY